MDRLRDAVPAGSYLALTHATLELGEQSDANAEAQAMWNQKAAVPITPRTKQQILRFFDGMEALEAGLVSMSRWRPDGNPDQPPAEVAGYSGVARKV